MSSSSSAPWSCQVSIRWEFDMNDKPLDKVSEVRFGPLITDKGNVELALRRAQAAVLNPSLPATSFLACSMDELKNGALGNQKVLQFSRNVVCVDLEGPTLTDLNFIDMPDAYINFRAAGLQFTSYLFIDIQASYKMPSQKL
jgi:hypothetical protein